MPTVHDGSSPVIEVKRLDPSVVNRTHEHPGLAKGTRALVTGTGSVRDLTVSQLIAAGCSVAVLGEASLVPPGCARVEGSVMSPETCDKAVQKQDFVVHVGLSPSFSAECLVEGTKNLLKAASAAGVKGFIFASSSSVVFDGTQSNPMSEDTPYAKHFVDDLAAAMADAERAVLRANNGDGMQTCSVRAAAIYGPESSGHLVPGFASLAKMRARSVGDGTNVVESVYVGNVAHGLLLAAQGLRSTLPRHAGDSPDENSGMAGRAVFVTDMEPVPFGEFASRALSRLGYRAAGDADGAGTIPVALATLVAFLLRIVALVISPIVDYRPMLTRRRILEESSTQRFDMSPAVKEGLDIALHDAKSLRNPRAKLKHVGPFTSEEVAKHSSEDDAWIIVDGKVYDVTPYLGQHPGGDAILRNAGGDSTEGMYGPQHPMQAMEILEQHLIGSLEN